MNSIQLTNQSPQDNRGFFWTNDQMIGFKKITRKGNIKTIESCFGIILYPRVALTLSPKYKTFLQTEFEKFV